MTTTHPRVSRQPHPAPSRLSRAGDVLLAALAGVMLLALLAGTPVALAQWIGWPLPHQWPTPARIKTALTSPFTDRAELDVLACLCWTCWLVFVIDVVRAVPAAVHDRANGWSRPAGRVGPMRLAAAVLIGTIASGLLGARLAASPSSESSTGHQAVMNDTADLLALHAPQNSGPKPITTVTVREPEDGVHDSLWRIAQRTLGDGNRWPEIYWLNEGRTQPDGERLMSPSLIKPGWILRLPGTHRQSATTEPGTGQPTPPSTHPKPTPIPPPTRTPAQHETTPAPNVATSTPTSAAPPPDVRPTDSGGHGVDIGDGVYVSLGLAAAISSALVTSRRRRRRSYVPGSGRRDDLRPSVPIIRNLQLAHLRETGGAVPLDDDDAEDEPVPTPTASIKPPPGDDLPTTHLDLRGVDTGHGLGVVGPGADAAVRALLLDNLTDTPTGDHPTELVIPRADAHGLLGSFEALVAHPRIQVVDDLDTALDQTDAAVLHHERLQSQHAEHESAATAPIVLITRQPPDSARLQATLDVGAPLGVRAVVLGQWRTGTSCHITTGGILTAISDPQRRHLVGRRVFTVTKPAARELLAALTPQPAAASSPHERSGAAPEPVQYSVSEQAPHWSNGRAPDSQTQPSAGNEDPGVAARLTLFGIPRLHWIPPDGAVTDLMTALSKRQRELIVLLALNPAGLERGRLAETLWPGGPPDRPFNSLHTTLSRLRRALSTTTADKFPDLIATSGDRYLLAPGVVEVDYWDFDRALASRRTARGGEEHLSACRGIVAAYQGELASGMDADWLETPREAARRDALDAATELARSVVETDPQQALNLLETACEFDPLNEQIYCSIMRTQRRLGRVDAIARTVALLTARLADIGEAPAAETLHLAEALRRRPAAQAPGARAVNG